MEEKPSKPGSDWVRYAGLGFDFAAAVGGFTLVGYLIDRHWQMFPTATLTGAILGLVGGMYNLIRGSLAAFKRNQPHQPPGPAKDDGAP